MKQARALKGLTPPMKCSGLEVFLLLATHRPEADTQPHLATRGQRGASPPSAWKQGEQRNLTTANSGNGISPSFSLSLHLPDPRTTFSSPQLSRTSRAERGSSVVPLGSQSGPPFSGRDALRMRRGEPGGPGSLSCLCAALCKGKDGLSWASGSDSGHRCGEGWNGSS